MVPVFFHRCLAKKKCFAPAALYKPFGDQAAGALSLSQFQALQEGDGEIASLRELGLTDREIQLWQDRESLVKFSGLGADPAAVQERLRAIEEKIEERQRLRSMPQRFAGSKPLNRREMEIEKAMFQGTDRYSFLKALYYQDVTSAVSTSDEKCIRDQSDPIKQLEMICDHLLPKSESNPSETGDPSKIRPRSSMEIPSTATSEVGPHRGVTGPYTQSYCDVSPADQWGNQRQEAKVESNRRFSVKVPIRTLPSAGPHSPQRVTQQVESVPEEEIRRNKLSEEEIRMIPRFSSYNPGQPSRVLYLKNLNPKATLEDLFSLFVSFQERDGPQLHFRLLTGRMKGQAFITFPSVEMATEALTLVNGYNLMGKPIIIEYGQHGCDQ
uniref:RNA-binding protein 41-like protein n=1 Tax=Callorhinchus milii TaxID=7868 RepID=V9L048_CALMI